MKVNKTALVTVRMDAALAERLGDLANRAGISRSQLACNLLSQGVECLSRADKVGLVSLAILLKDLQIQLKSWVEHIRDEGESVNMDWLNGCFDEELKACKHES